MEKILFTSESVTEGHPDKMCDAISDAILDALIEQDPMSRVACETATTTGLVLVMGEITTNGYVDIQKIVRDTVREIGYTRGKYGFDADTCAVITAIDEQSADIALGVDKALEAKMGEDEIDAIGAGDQGIQFGYASNETEEYMPYAINMAHKLARQLTKIRKDGTLSYLRPDGKHRLLWSITRKASRYVLTRLYALLSMIRRLLRSRSMRISKNTYLTLLFRQIWWMKTQNISSILQDVL